MNLLGRKPQIPSPTVSSEAPREGNDRVFAILRRIDRRLTELEAKVSNDRRDINRIERKLNRDTEVNPAPDNKNTPPDWILPNPFQGGL